MKFQVRVFLLFIFVFGFSYFSLATSANDEKDNPAGIQDEIILNYQTVSVTPYNVCKLKDGQILKVTIKALAPGANYSIDVSGTESADGKSNSGSRDGDGSIKTLKIEHSPIFSSYTITIIPLDNKSEGTTRIWTIPVRTIKWSIDFSSAFIFSTNTNKRYYLEETDEQSVYYIRERDEAKDKFNLGFAAMAHLVKTNNESKVTWAPISFGVGVNSDTDPRFFLGTSLRFGNAMYVTGGIDFGTCKRLPAEIGVNETTDDPAVITKLESQYKCGFYIGVSYSFGGSKAQDHLLKPFVTSSQTSESPPSDTILIGGGSTSGANDANKEYSFPATINPDKINVNEKQITIDIGTGHSVPESGMLVDVYIKGSEANSQTIHGENFEYDDASHIISGELNKTIQNIDEVVELKFMIESGDEFIVKVKK